MITITLKGAAKEAHSSRAGIYILHPDDVNGKEHWVQQGGSNALWYDKTLQNWKIGKKDNLGSSTGGIKSDDSITPLETTIWKYTKNDTWIEASGEIILSPGNTYLIKILFILAHEELTF